ncbi:MAG: hypothetical protein H0V17_34460 [Deltaproteobacteria bacterium]|nr:hypothetical protein [Deltaproteobacteria bacterium]
MSTRLALLALVVISAPARADQWMTPTAKTLTSPNQKLQAVITPAKDGTSGATAAIGDKGRLAAKTFTMATRWMPVDVVLFDDGILLALDHWHKLGYDKVATLYERDGKIRWEKSLVDLVGQPFIETADRSTSSIWWRKTPLEWTLSKDGKSGSLTLFDEDQLQLTLRDGSAVRAAGSNMPDDPPRLLNRARAMARRPGEELAAIMLLERAFAKDPELHEALTLYVDLLQRTKDHARAVATLEKVSARWKTTKGTSVANVYVVWATSLVALSRTADAERVLRLAVTAAPTYSNPTIALAKLLADQKKLKEVDVVLDAFVARLFEPSYLDSYALGDVANFYRTRKELPKALALYLKSYKKDQVTNQHLYASLAQLYEEMGNRAEAIRINEQLLAYFVKQGSAFDFYAKHVRAELARLKT